MKQEEFDSFYRNYRNLMFFSAKQILQDDFLAEDAVAEAFLKIYKNFNRWFQEDNTKAKNLAVLITKNCAIDIVRKNKKMVVTELKEEEEDQRSTQEIVDEKLEMDMVYQCICRLKEQERMILLLRCIYELSEKEAAQLLGITARAVSMRLCRARQHLKKELRKEGIKIE